MSKPKVFGDYYAVATDASPRLRRYVTWANDGKLDSYTLDEIGTWMFIAVVVPSIYVAYSPLDNRVQVIIIAFWCSVCAVAARLLRTWLVSRARRQLRRETLGALPPKISGQKIVLVNSTFCTALAALVTTDGLPLQVLEAFLTWSETHFFAEFADLNYLAITPTPEKTEISLNDFKQRCATLYSVYNEYRNA